MDKAKVDVVAEFQVFQPFFNACGTYYSDGFDDCLKQVGVAYPDLNLFQIVIDDTILLTFEEDVFVSNEPDNSIHTVE